MSDKDILFNAIKKAEGNGYKNSDFHYPMCREQSDNIIKYYWASPIIFSHEFAIAFWGEKDNCVDIQIYSDLNKDCQYRWQYHLSKMVLENEPLKYLEKFL